MFHEQFHMSDNQYSTNITISDNEAILNYPCPSNTECTSYKFILQPGVYQLKAYGASAGNQVSQALAADRASCIATETVKLFGGNAICRTSNYSGGSGGFISGVLKLKHPTQCYVNIGGKGSYEMKTISGGYNGGGANSGRSNYISATGGGATDLRVGVDDVYHRILVAGGGGGTDNDEGNGGCGGYPDGQGYWKKGEYNGHQLATQSSGYSFGQGQNATTTCNDCGGAGGGWFGGYASNDNYAGAGGGSSYALTKTSVIPSLNSERHYEFTNKSPYVLDHMLYANGIWEGNGKLHIIKLRSLIENTCKHSNRQYLYAILILFLINK